VTDPYLIAFAAHLAVIGYYMGSDLVVNQSTWYFINSTADPVAERSRKLHFLLLCDQHPRMGLILFIATGFTVEILAGLSPLPAAALPWIWIVCGVWFANVWISFLNERKPWGKRLVDIDVGWRFLVGGTFLLTGIWSLVGDGPFEPQWMALKYLLLGTLIAGGVSIRYYVRELAAAWPVFLREGSTPAFEAIVRRTLAGASYVNWGLWAIFITMALLTVFRPF
jgi:hypothetical protein